MEAADGALREGALYDLVGRIRHQDVRSAAIEALAARYHVDVSHARRVETTAVALLERVARSWRLADETAEQVLRWAARVHEVGLDISHSQYHKHGSYIVGHSDLAGFSREEQRELAALVRVHRRKFAAAPFRELGDDRAARARRLAVLLRLAIVLHRGRSPVGLPDVQVAVDDDHLVLTFPPGWLGSHPLAEADLRAEADYLAAAGFTLRFG